MVTALVLGVLVLAYVRVGWWRMEAACTSAAPGDAAESSVELGWSWAPAGFRCTYDDGRSTTSSWF